MGANVLQNIAATYAVKEYKRDSETFASHWVLYKS
jgi:hypothetical protein